jgi:hypothetical protein
MGTTLTGTKPKDTYDSLIKVTDNGPISGTLKALSDGLGNDSTLSLSTTAASIAGTLAVSGDFSIADKIVHIGDTNTAIRFPSADTITFETSGFEAARITSAGNVGIGSTATTGARLESVVSSAGATPTVALRLQNTGASYQAKMVLTDGNTNDGNIIYQGGATADGQYIGFGIGSAVNDVQVTASRYLRMAASTGGIQFNGDTAAANALDDYEEGTFTPTASSGITINTINNATYTKIGNTVTFQIWIKVDIGSADFVIAGLPFTGSGRTTGSMSNTSQKETIANLLINNEIYGYAATTVLDDDLLISGVYRVA